MISLRGVKKTYKIGQASVEALKDINMDIQQGEMVVLSGISGSGKTTLLNLIGAMDTPTGGSVVVDDEDITNYSGAELTNFRARSVGYIFQSFNLIPALNVYENIVIPLQLKRQKYEKSKILTLIENVGLIDYVSHKTDQLSGGQRQRVAIARAMANNPRYIMADEPTANLDSKTAESILGLLKKLNDEQKVTIIFASHDPFLKKYVEKKIHLKDGVIVG